MRPLRWYCRAGPEAGNAGSIASLPGDLAAGRAAAGTPDDALLVGGAAAPDDLVEAAGDEDHCRCCGEAAQRDLGGDAGQAGRPVATGGAGAVPTSGAVPASGAAARLALSAAIALVILAVRSSGMGGGSALASSVVTPPRSWLRALQRSHPARCVLM